MKYMYILLSIMSSFFIHKSLYAKDIELQYAFFVPSGAFQENTQVEDIKLQARYPKKDISTSSNFDSREDIKEETLPKKQDKNHLRRKISLPYERTQLKKMLEKQKTIKSDSTPKKRPQKPQQKHTTPPPEINIVIKQPTIDITTPSKASEAYELEENIPVLTAEHIIIKEEPEEIKEETKPALNTTEQLLKADVYDLLKTIERADSSKPLFQQLYGLYGTELRSFYRHGKLPPNLSLEDTLNKANSLLRFEVK